MTLSRISPDKAKRLIDDGSVLVDIREADEHARSRIAGARHAPLSRLDRLDLGNGNGKPTVIFYCRSGQRTASNAEKLAGATDGAAFILDGGLDAWKGAGLPVVETRNQPIEVMRQVQIVAGGLVVTGAALGAVVHPGFHALSAFVGAGLVFAGVSGSCMMARILSLAPWNRAAAASRA